MLSAETEELLVDRLAERINNVNTYILQEIGKKIKELSTVPSTQARQLGNMMKYGGDYNKILNELSKITKLNIKEIDKIFNEVAKSDYRFAEQFYKYRNLQYVAFEENAALQTELDAVKRVTFDKYANLSNTKALGYGIKNEDGTIVFKALKEVYDNVIDEAVLSVEQGQTTFSSALRRTLDSIGDSGLKVVYESGYARRLDTSIKMNLSDAINDLHNRQQEALGEQFGANGVEVTAHTHPAPDHALLQGRQFTDEEYAKLNNQEKAVTYNGIVIPADKRRRKVSTLNCQHYERRIIVGVSKQMYSDDTLDKVLKDNDEGVMFEGKHYTLYELTQLQRQVELKIRQLLDRKTLAESSGDTEELNKVVPMLTNVRRKHRQIRKLLKENTEVII